MQSMRVVWEIEIVLAVQSQEMAMPMQKVAFPRSEMDQRVLSWNLKDAQVLGELPAIRKLSTCIAVTMVPNLV